MIKYLTLLTLTTALVATEAPKFNGFYLGAEAGLASSSSTGELGDSHGTLKSKKKSSHLHANYGVFGGYGMDLNSIYLGAEIGASFHPCKKFKKYSYSANGQTDTVSANYKRGIVFSAAPRLGVIFCQSYLAYVKPTVEFSKDHTIARGSDQTVKGKKTTNVTFVPGVGLEKAFSNHVLVRTEYAYSFAKKLKATDEDNITHSVKQRSHVLKLGVAYRF